jgi:hypothetical protein
VTATPADGALYVHYLKFKNECLSRDGFEFQSFFEGIMEKADPTFIKVKPSGREGDWKNDGYSTATKTVFQVYAPENLTVAKTVVKITEDFSGALVRWGDDMQGWVFVWSAHKGLPPQVLDTLNKIKSGNPTIACDDWGHQALWDVVKQLSAQDRVELLGPIPILDAEATRVIVGVTAAEIQVLLAYIEEASPTPLDENLDQVALGEKLDRNAFSDPIRTIINGSLPLLGTVGYYVNNHPLPDFSQRVARDLAAVYERLKTRLEGDSDAIFVGLVEELAPSAHAHERRYWGAVATISYYFELCDIFER